MEHVLAALLAGLFTWSLTALGAALVFLPGKPSARWQDASLGFAGGVMMAASYWSLLDPGVQFARELGQPGWLVVPLGCAAGAAFLRLADWLLPHLHPGLDQPEGLRTSWHRTVLLTLAITLHNIPEGLAVGVAFGALALHLPGASLGAALGLTLGIGLQNLPEGFAVAMPIRREGASRLASFGWGQASALVEPVAAALGAALVIAVRPLLPFALAFAAGAMIFVVIEEVLPEAHQHGHADLASLAFMAGFLVMMLLDLGLTPN